MNDTLENLMTKLEATVYQRMAERERLIGALFEALEFIEDQADVEDGDYGDPRPNRAMSLASEIKDTLESVGEAV